MALIWTGILNENMDMYYDGWTSSGIWMARTKKGMERRIGYGRIMDGRRG
jgi:hypothetical protein